MAGWCSTLMIGGFLAASVLSPKANAAVGRITFSGAVVEPTCNVSTTELAGATHSSQWRTCVNPRRIGQAQPQVYSITMRSVAAASNGDRLLAYFGQYLVASDKDAQATLVTQTYE